MTLRYRYLDSQAKMYITSQGATYKKNIISFMNYSSRHTITRRWKIGLSSLTLLINNCEKTEDKLVADDVFQTFTALIEHHYQLYFINI